MNKDEYMFTSTSARTVRWLPTDINAVTKQNFVYIECCSGTSINSVSCVVVISPTSLLHCRCLVYNHFYFILYISFNVACAFVICLLKYLLTYLLTSSGNGVQYRRKQARYYEVLAETMTLSVSTSSSHAVSTRLAGGGATETIAGAS